MSEQAILAEYMRVVYTIQCDKCGLEKSDADSDEYYFADELIEEGWRGMKSGAIYCPKCAPKVRIKKR